MSSDQLSPTENTVNNDINHAQIAANLLANLPTLSSNAIVTMAGVHATLALVQSNTRIAALMAQQLREQETTNLFAMQVMMSTADPEQDLLQHELQHRTIGCPEERHAAREAAKPDTLLLADCLAANDQAVIPGNIVAVNLQGKSLSVIAVDPAEDAWLLTHPDKFPAPVNSAAIATLIQSDLALASLTVSSGDDTSDS